MSTEKAITNFQNQADAVLDEQASAIVKACTGNANFTFTGGALTNATSAQGDYHTKLAASAGGGVAATTAKDLAKTVLENDLHLLALQVNLQANGDITKLQSSAIPLVAHGTPQQMPVPANLQIKQTDVSGSFLVSVDVPNVHDHGTLFAIAPITSTDTNPNDWKMYHANGHSRTIKGLTAGTSYRICAAFKGADDADLVFCAPITKMVV